MSPHEVILNRPVVKYNKQYSKRLRGLEPPTFCMASRRSSQLSYSRKPTPLILQQIAGFCRLVFDQLMYAAELYARS